MTESGGQGPLLARIAAGEIDRGVAEALLTQICHASPGSYSELSPSASEAFLDAAVALGGQGPRRELIALHYMGSLLFDQADRWYEDLIEKNPDGAADLLRRKGALFGIVNADVAVAAYARLLELQPDDDRSHLNLAALLNSTGRVADAADAYRTIILRSSDLRAIQEAAAHLHSTVVLLRLQPLSRWAHSVAVRLLPKALEQLPRLAVEVERNGPLAWDFHAAIAIVYWVLDAIRNEGTPRPAGLWEETIAGLAKEYGCALPDRSGGLPQGVTAERARAFDERWSEGAVGALADCIAFLEINTETQISETGNWILGGYGATDVEWEDAWLVGDGISTVAREFLKPLK